MKIHLIGDTNTVFIPKNKRREKKRSRNKCRNVGPTILNEYVSGHTGTEVGITFECQQITRYTFISETRSFLNSHSVLKDHKY